MRTAARALAGRGLDVEAHPLDVTDAESVRALAHHLAHSLGGADVLVNNAGLLRDESGDVLDADVQDFRDCMETNVYGPLRLAQVLMPTMIARGYGRVVNAVDPGWVRSDMGGPSAPRSLAKGAETIVWCATLPNGGPSGRFFHDRKEIDW